MREIVYGQDGDFSWERFENRYNADLANNLGNLVQRIASMAEKYLDGKLPPGDEPGPLAEAARRSVASYLEHMESLALHEGASAAYGLIDRVNEFITESEPWAMAKKPEERDRLAGVLYDAAEATRIAAVLLYPVMPGSAMEILSRLGAPREPETLRLGDDAAWGAAGALEARKGAALWPRLEAKS